MKVKIINCDKCGESYPAWAQYHVCEPSKTASNELLGGREAGNNNEVDGKLNSPPLGSRKCPACGGRGTIRRRKEWVNYETVCEYCKGAGAK